MLGEAATHSKSSSRMLDPAQAGVDPEASRLVSVARR